MDKLFWTKRCRSALTRIRNAIINVNTGLAGVGAMFEYFNWAEANYKSDEVGKTAALLSMGGGLAIEGAIGSLGMLAGSSLSAAHWRYSPGLSYATLGIGIVLITIAIIYNYFARKILNCGLRMVFGVRVLSIGEDLIKRKLTSGLRIDLNLLKIK